MEQFIMDPVTIGVTGLALITVFMIASQLVLTFDAQLDRLFRRVVAPFIFFALTLGMMFTMGVTIWLLPFGG